jgi:hypothetical protein
LPLPIAANADPNWQSYTDGHARVTSQNNIVRLENPISSDGLFFPQLICNPLNYDFLEFQIKYTDAPIPPVLKVRWNIDKSSGSDTNTAAIGELPELSEHQFKTIRIRLSHSLHWYTTGAIKNVALELFPAKSIDIINIALVPTSQVAPSISVSSTPSQFGIVPITTTSVFTAPDATQVQISKPDYFFENTLTDNAVAATIPLPAAKTNFTAADLNLSRAAMYQIRARRTNGEWSEPLTIQFYPN